MSVRVGLLQTGDQGEAIAAKYRSNADLFKTMLDGQGFEFDVYEVNRGKLPISVHAADSYLITGSQHGVYEKLAWISELEQFVRDCFVAIKPVVGICFGHQVMAQALGGKVEKFKDGWALGRQEYRDFDGKIFPINAFHQDQVLAAPADSTLILTSDFCACAALSYGERGLSFQGHPEMDAEFILDLLDVKADFLAPHQIATARASLEPMMDVSTITSQIVDMLTSQTKK
ncbi:type 1 glutamine amidotransferase [Lentilitoribacter sp. EG35]|jgi:GMP synthase (glutamine-hydrolysing)|uniref:type 1 glutamine amidotransferase n=1 Tax=Lentilitoribacter sp. EG35 TaxID=3234192 RepID=UPI0034611E76